MLTALPRREEARIGERRRRQLSVYASVDGVAFVLGRQAVGEAEWDEG